MRERDLLKQLLPEGEMREPPVGSPRLLGFNQRQAECPLG
jgi:hypothetical protein